MYWYANDVYQVPSAKIGVEHLLTMIGETAGSQGLLLSVVKYVAMSITVLLGF